MNHPVETTTETKELVPEQQTRPGRSYRPQVDIIETEDSLWLRADMPGVDERSVEVSLEDGVLTLQGLVSLDEYDALEPVYTEYNVGNWEHRFRLGNRIDADRIAAKVQHGVLELQLPKAASAQPRRIEIGVG
jgi:HSP20 family molecular chaperone IbpA